MTTRRLANASAAGNGKIVIRQQAKARVRVEDGDYLAEFVGPIREARSGQGLVQDVKLIEPDVLVPLYANIPKGDITPSTKIGQILAALGVPVTEDLCTDTLTGRRCWVRVRAAHHTVAYDGEFYTLPLPDGPGKALKLGFHPYRPDVPIYLAAIGPQNLELTGEIADGWLSADGSIICRAFDLKVGLVRNVAALAPAAS